MGQSTDPAHPIFIFIDESGDLLPKGSGSSNLVLSGFITTSPVSAATRIVELRYELLGKGLGIRNFHATDDSRIVRGELFTSIAEIGEGLCISFGFEKPQSHSLVNNIKSYISLLLLIAQEAIALNVDSNLVVLLIDATLDKAAKTEAKRRLKQLFKGSNQKCFVYFQSMKRDACGQIADYLAWSHFQELERQNNSYIELFKEAFETRHRKLDDPPG